MIVGTVNGYAEIGNIVHDISGLVLPAGMLPGDMIVLIDGTSEKLTGSPANDKFTTGKYEFELKVTSEQLLAVLTVEYPDITDPEVVDPEVIEPEKPDPEIIDPIKPGPGPASTYFIIASADSGTTISPAGKVKVGTGKSATFTFSAIEGYKIASVKVDGKALSQAMMSLGYHTFSAVDSDHTIEVIGEEVPVLLTITVYTGKGYAEYSVNGRPFVTYTSAVILPLHADVVVRAVAEDGHSFDRWETPEIRKTAEISFNDIRSALTLDLFFTDSEEGTGGNGTDGEETGGTEGKEDNGLTAWMAGWLAMLLFIAVLLLILMMFRREYDVIKLVSSAQIIGEDRVRRKREYAFTIEGGPSGTVSYRITRDGEWKEILPNADGTYVIPKGEVVGELTIKHHRTPY